jgi:hypothetical protein
MSAPLSKQAAAGIRPNPLAVFHERAEARAMLVECGELSLHDAVDELQASAQRGGLVDEYGQDAIQAIMATAFGGRP